MIYHKE
nr:unnamed protein product [Callosobruchus chinensis]